MDFYLDATCSLPAAVVFNEHPDNNAVINIAIEVDFSNYQAISGAQIPMHVERLLNGSPILDITVNNILFNAGLTLSDFSVN